ncbi:NAD(P)-binding protein [Aspergillus ellipticus CBS 707.79]|uniref:NAD(P)-binding protein n=1 Tax=Aspergillus ellipticus CBS 707.79 TaxID=1448320 RepID=A0A319EDF3_9EURO|nr:NAD(P)-binding protein [Aspergillus ellipticus CBS 707.79]
MSDPKNQTILVTGASGFVATHILNVFLRAGYSVRGTVRSDSTAEKVRQTFSQYESQLSFAIVEDMGKPGAFDTAVQGVSDYERDLLRPAIDGTRNILASVHQHAPNVKRVVITSSFAAMSDVTKGNWPGHVYSEADWNPMTYEVAAAKGAFGGLAYSTAKALAERAAWDFVQEKKAQFDIATILPPIVYGPNMNTTADLASLNTSSADIYRLMSPQSKSSDPVPANMFWSWIDVRDVAEAHLRAYEVPEAGGERLFICNKDHFTYQKICDSLRANVPELKDRVPVGNQGKSEFPDLYTTDNSKSRNILGLKYHDLEETVVDAARSLLALEANRS